MVRLIAEFATFAAGEGIRIDSHIESGSMVPPYYDSLLGKLIVWGHDRSDALNRLQGALHRCYLDGVATNLELHRAVLANETFIKGGVTTGFLPGLLETVSLEDFTHA